MIETTVAPRLRRLRDVDTGFRRNEPHPVRRLAAARQASLHSDALQTPSSIPAFNVERYVSS
jgi:hypothetical protein